MMLADKGLLDIDAPLITYIPEFQMADERYKEITPRMLMNHSSGIYGSSFSNSFLFDDPDKTAHDTLLDRLATQGLKADPGEMSDYCNDGFSLLEILVERVSGISYTEFLAENFSQPLGLAHTKTPQDDFDRGQLVKVYLPIYDGVLPNDTVNVLGTGGLYSTANDLCRFAEVLMGNRPEILSEKSALLMQNEEYKKGLWPEDHAENLFGYGLGWDTVHGFPFGDYGIQAVVKGGDSGMFHSSLLPFQSIILPWRLFPRVVRLRSITPLPQLFCRNCFWKKVSSSKSALLEPLKRPCKRKCQRSFLHIQAYMLTPARSRALR
jgi:CubicO group peptidase (beta-lactamase class C family)